MDVWGMRERGERTAMFGPGVDSNWKGVSAHGTVVFIVLTVHLEQYMYAEA